MSTYGACGKGEWHGVENVVGKRKEGKKKEREEEEERDWDSSNPLQIQSSVT